jgi:hypothetical protein
MTTTERCSGRVFGQWRNSPCSRSAKVQENGKGWCVQHSPTKVAERKAKSNADLKQKTEDDRLYWEKRTYDGAAGERCRSLGISKEDLGRVILG